MSVRKYPLGIGGLMVCVLLAAGQSAPWGEPSHGVRMRVDISAGTKNTPPQLPGELPHFEIQLQNVAKDDVVLHNLSLSLIVIDDLPFGPALTRDNIQNSQIPSPLRIGPGGQSANVPISFPAVLYELNDIGAPVPRCVLHLKPGKHTVRVTISGAVTEESSYNGRQGFTLVQAHLESNPITIDIPGAPGESRSGITSPAPSCAPRA